MIISKKEYETRGLHYIIRSANQKDAEMLSDLRLKIDGETENLDRERGEAFIDVAGFERLIDSDTKKDRNLFLVAEVEGRIVAFSRCEGTELKRFSHKVEFGVGVSKAYWGYRIGKNLLKESISWADAAGVKKMDLFVLETNEKAIHLYKRLGFEIEGRLKNDRMLSDGKYYDTMILGRFKD